MSVRKAITLAGLALAVAALSPASAPAAAGGTDRPVKGYVAGENAVSRTSLTTFDVSAHASGVLSHLGENVTADFTGSGFLTGIGTPNVGTEHHGNVLVTADNGDTLIGDFTVRGPAPAFAPHQIEVEIVITGGTGRFRGRQRQTRIGAAGAAAQLRWRHLAPDQRGRRHRADQLLAAEHPAAPTVVSLLPTRGSEPRVIRGAGLFLARAGSPWCPASRPDVPPADGTVILPVPIAPIAVPATLAPMRSSPSRQPIRSKSASCALAAAAGT
jgi:hypothetical protein